MSSPHVGGGWGPPAAQRPPSSKGRRPAVQKTPCNKGILFTRTPGPPLAIASLPSGQYALQNAKHPPKTCSPTDAFNHEPPFQTSTKPQGSALLELGKLQKCTRNSPPSSNSATTPEARLVEKSSFPSARTRRKTSRIRTFGARKTAEMHPQLASKLQFCHHS